MCGWPEVLKGSTTRSCRIWVKCDHFLFGILLKNCLGEGSFMVVVRGFNATFGLGFEAVYATPPFQVIKR